MIYKLKISIISFCLYKGYSTTDARIDFFGYFGINKWESIPPSSGIEIIDIMISENYGLFKISHR